MKISQLKHLSLINSLILLTVITISQYYLYKSDLLTTVLESNNHDCLVDSVSFKRLCINCVQRRKLNISHNSMLRIYKDKTEFSLIKIPQAGKLNCAQIMQILNYNNMNKIMSPQDIELETISSIDQIFKQQNFQWQNSVKRQILIPASFEQVVIVDFEDKKWPIQNNLLMFVPKQSELIIQKLVGQASVALLLVFSLLFVYFMLKKQQKRYYLLISIFIFVIVNITSLDENLSVQNKQPLIHLAQTLFFGFVFMKIGCQRLVIWLIIVLFGLSEKPSTELILICAYLLLFLIYQRIKIKQNANTNGDMFMVLCLVLFAMNVWMKQQIQFSYMTLSVVIEYALLIVGTLLISLKDKQQDIQLPNGYNSCLIYFNSIRVKGDDDNQN